MRRMLTNGLIAGLAGGVALATYVVLFGQRFIQDAIDYEEESTHASEGGAHAHEELFSRGVQEIGGAIGLLIFGLALGVIFSIVLASLMPRFWPLSDLQASLRLGAVGFFAIVVVPFLKYPPNPPAVGDASTINERTILYFCLLGLSIALALGTWHIVRNVAQTGPSRAWLGAGVYVIGLAVVLLSMPGPVDPIDAPTILVWNFRLASLGGLATAWATMSLTIGTLRTNQSVRSDAVPVSA